MNSIIKIVATAGILIAGMSGFAQIKSVDQIGITVSNMEASIRFYHDVLGFQQISSHEYTGEAYEKLKNIFGLHIQVVQMQLGEEVIELTHYLTSGGRTIPPGGKANDLVFQHMAIVVSNMDQAYLHLRKYKVEHVSTAPQTLPASIAPAAGIKAFYFNDPDKHTLELIYFPPGKGQAKWHHHKKGKIFLGIDHTAIGVSNTDSSLLFYQTVLGLEKKGESYNFGTEQEHLNNVEGARLRITGLRSQSGPGIEFLQYLNPGPGKLYPPDTQASDLWYWQTTLLTQDPQRLYDTLKALHYAFVSRELVELDKKNAKTRKAFIVKDPDGHAILIQGYGVKNSKPEL